MLTLGLDKPSISGLHACMQSLTVLFLVRFNKTVCTKLEATSTVKIGRKTFLVNDGSFFDIVLCKLRGLKVIKRLFYFAFGLFFLFF